MGEIVLVDKDGKQYTEEKVHDYNLPMYVVTLLSYKDFAFKQSAAGLWGENILSLCQPNSISQLKASHQTLDQQILKLSGSFGFGGFINWLTDQFLACQGVSNA